MKVAHIIMPNSAKVSLMLRFPFLTIQEQGKSLFIGKKKKRHYSQHKETYSTTAQPSCCIWIYPSAGPAQAHFARQTCLHSAPPAASAPLPFCQGCPPSSPCRRSTGWARRWLRAMGLLSVRLVSLPAA